MKFRVSSVTPDEAKLIADAYFRGQRNPTKIAKILEADSFDSAILHHPLVKAEIISIRNSMNDSYSLSDHLEKLKEIRDSAMGDENWKVALTAEVAVGKAAGLYEPRKEEESNPEKGEAQKLTTDELRKRLASMKPSLPEETTLIADYGDGEVEEPDF